MDIDNLKYFMIYNISGEFVGEPKEQDNYYIIKYDIIELDSLETHQIQEQILQSEKNTLINGAIAKIIIENNPHIQEHQHHLLYYDTLIRGINCSCDSLLGYCTEPLQLFFNGIKLQESITSWEHLIYLPNYEIQHQRLLYNINSNLEAIARVLNDNSSANNEILQSIQQELNFMNYLSQTQ